MYEGRHLLQVGKVDLALHQTGVLLVLSRTGALRSLSHAARAGISRLGVLGGGLGAVTVLGGHLATRAGGFDSTDTGVGLLATSRGGHFSSCCCWWWWWVGWVVFVFVCVAEC